MKTLDLRNDLKHLYAPSAKKVEFIQVPRLQFAMIDGAIEKGYEPGTSPSFQEATPALYGFSYTLKFMLKKHKSRAFARESGYRDCVGPGGKHHEIYLGDPRKADSSKLKTVLRHPVEKV